MRYLWHCTRLDFLNKILKEGIKAKVPGQREYKPKGVYLSEYQFNWMWNTTKSGYFKGATIKLNIDGLKIIKDFHIDAEDKAYDTKRMMKDYICLEDIGPERIIEVLIE